MQWHCKEQGCPFLMRRHTLLNICSVEEKYSWLSCNTPFSNKYKNFLHINYLFMSLTLVFSVSAIFTALLSGPAQLQRPSPYMFIVRTPSVSEYLWLTCTTLSRLEHIIAGLEGLLKQ